MNEHDAATGRQVEDGTPELRAACAAAVEEMAPWLPHVTDEDATRIRDRDPIVGSGPNREIDLAMDLLAARYSLRLCNAAVVGALLDCESHEPAVIRVREWRQQFANAVDSERRESEHWRMEAKRAIDLWHRTELERDAHLVQSRRLGAAIRRLGYDPQMLADSEAE